jgi:monoamine oxidase
MTESTDVVIIGAGAAGLAAAQRLHKHKREIIVLEARDRIGGRMWTLHPKSLEVPVELGAEFVHGEAPELREIARQNRLRIVDIAENRWTSEGKKLRRLHDFWKQLDPVMGRLEESRTPDRSFAAALARQHSVSARDRALAKEYVEGFFAADTTGVSERSLAGDSASEGDEQDRRIGRVVEGYDSVLASLSKSIHSRVRLGAVVHKISWRRNRVEVHVRDRRGKHDRIIRAKSAVIAIPLGVLQAGTGELGAIEFDPPLPEKDRAAGRMAMGAVVRIALELETPLWTEPKFASRVAGEGFDAMSFLHATGRVAFPVWWTPYPVRAPLLVGWRGGPGARDLARLTKREIVENAITSLAAALHSSAATIRKHLVAAHLHDWINDPFSRGVYSYVRVGGTRAPAALAKAVQGTLHFAGEHVDRQGRSGTVHGAIASGWTAADEILKKSQ